jgi:ribosomal protein L32
MSAILWNKCTKCGTREIDPAHRITPETGYCNVCYDVLKLGTYGKEIDKEETEDPPEAVFVRPVKAREDPPLPLP